MANFIVDTSVRIDFFHGKLPGHVRENLAAGLENGQVSVTDVVVHELLVGTLTRKQYDELADLLSPLPVLRIRDEELDAFNRFCWQVRRKGLSGKYADLTIAFLSRHHGQPILSFDGYFKKLSRAGFVAVIVV